MTRSVINSPRAGLDRVRGWLQTELDAHVQPLLDYADALATASTTAGGGTGDTLTATTIEALRHHAEAIVDASPATVGAGFIAAPYVVDGQERYALWLKRIDHAVHRLRLNFDISDLDAYDYVEMEWFVRARDRRQPCLTGPYLDYSGSDALVLTVSVPVVTERGFLGVVAIDLLAQATEDLMTAQLRSLPGEVVVVNRDRTVVAANSVRWMPGERLRSMPSDDPDGYESAETIGTWTGWQFAVARP